MNHCHALNDSFHWTTKLNDGTQRITFPNIPMPDYTMIRLYLTLKIYPTVFLELYIQLNLIHAPLSHWIFLEFRYSHVQKQSWDKFFMYYKIYLSMFFKLLWIVQKSKSCNQNKNSMSSTLQKCVILIKSVKISWSFSLWILSYF